MTTHTEIINADVFGFYQRLAALCSDDAHLWNIL